MQKQYQSRTVSLVRCSLKRPSTDARPPRPQDLERWLNISVLHTGAEYNSSWDQVVVAPRCFPVDRPGFTICAVNATGSSQGEVVKDTDVLAQKRFISNALDATARKTPEPARCYRNVAKANGIAGILELAVFVRRIQVRPRRHEDILS